MDGTERAARAIARQQRGTDRDWDEFLPAASAAIDAIVAHISERHAQPTVRPVAEELPRVMRPSTLAKHWQCSERHVRNLIATGELPSFRAGGKLVRIRAEDVVEFEARAVSASKVKGHSAPIDDPFFDNAYEKALLLATRDKTRRR